MPRTFTRSQQMSARAQQRRQERRNQQSQWRQNENPQDPNQGVLTYGQHVQRNWVNGQQLRDRDNECKVGCIIS